MTSKRWRLSCMCWKVEINLHSSINGIKRSGEMKANDGYNWLVVMGSTVFALLHLAHSSALSRCAGS